MFSLSLSLPLSYSGFPLTFTLVHVILSLTHHSIKPLSSSLTIYHEEDENRAQEATKEQIAYGQECPGFKMVCCVLPVRKKKSPSLCCLRPALQLTESTVTLSSSSSTPSVIWNIVSIDCLTLPAVFCIGMGLSFIYIKFKSLGVFMTASLYGVAVASHCL